MASVIFEFADFKLDCGRFELRRGGSGVRLERKPMELLILLASSEGRLVTRAEIARRMWDSEVFVDTEHGINTAIRKIRTVLGDDPESPRFIQTVTGMGYRFIATVEARAEGAQTGVESGTEKGQISSGIPKEHTSGAKAPIDSALDVPGINPRPTARTAETNARPATRRRRAGETNNARPSTPTAETNARPTARTAETNARPATRTAETNAGATTRETNARPIAQTPEIDSGPATAASKIDPGPTAPTPGVDLAPGGRAWGMDHWVATGATPLRSRLRSIRAIWVALGAAGIIAAGLAAGVGPHPLASRLLGAAAEPSFSSLAVIPLENLSGDPGQEYFADGMTDEVITMLAKDSTLRITSRTSVMQYKGAHRPLQEIARALKVDAIIEGSVSRSNNRVHLTLQLIRADTDAHLWAESYDRDANDVALPDEAAQAIAKRLHSAGPSTATVRSVNPAAHDAYLRGRYLWFTRVEESAAYFRKATEIQPDYAAAWAGLSSYYGLEIARGDLDPRTSMAPELEAAERAVQLDPNLAEGHWAMGAALFIDRWDFAGADRELLRAISLDPRDAEIYYLRANLLQATNRFAESVEVEKKAMDLDPFSRPFGMAWIYLGARQYDEALADLRLRMEATPNSPDLLWTFMDIWRRKGDTKEEVDAAGKFYIALGQARAAAKLRLAYEQGGARGFLRWQLADKLAWAKSHYVSPVALALIHARLGEKEEALALMEEGYRRRATDLLWIQTDPAYDFLHADPRYRSIVQRIGQPPLY